MTKQDTKNSSKELNLPDKGHFEHMKERVKIVERV